MTNVTILPPYWCLMQKSHNSSVLAMELPVLSIRDSSGISDKKISSLTPKQLEMQGSGRVLSIVVIDGLVLKHQAISNHSADKIFIVLDNLLSYVIIPPAQLSCWGLYWFHSVRPVRLSRIPCPLCSAYSFGWIHFIFTHLINQLQKVCHI